MVDTNKELLINRAEDYAKKRDVDNSEISWTDVIDEELTDTENWDRIKDEVEDHMDLEEKLDDGKQPTEEEIRAKERELQEKYIEEIEKEKEEQLQQQFEDDEHEEVQSFYNMFNYYIKSVARGHHESLMVNAEPGIGKSYQTNQTLINEVGNEKFEKSPAVSSPFEFYKQLWELEQDEEKEILVLDDIEGLLKNKKALSILKQATWSETDERWVGWNSSPSKLKTKDGQDIPEEFKFTGKLIMIFNEVPKDDVIFQSLKDRCFYYEISFTYEQKCKLIQAIADKGMDYGVDKEQRKEMASWLVDLTTPATTGLNLRTFELALKHHLASQDINEDGITWKKVIKESLEINENLRVARDIIKNGGHTMVKERKKEFKERTGKSGKTYERARDQLEENSEEIEEILEED